MLYSIKRSLLCFISLLCLYPIAHAGTDESINAYLNTIKSNPQALYTFFKAMPKSGDLHYHLDGSNAPETLISLAASGDYCLDPSTFMVSKTTSCHGVPLATLPQNPKLYAQTIKAWSMQDFQPNNESGHDHFFAVFAKNAVLERDFRPQLLAAIMRRAAAQHELYLEMIVLLDKHQDIPIPHDLSKTDFTDLSQKLLANKDFKQNIQDTILASENLIATTRHELGCDAKKPETACQLMVKFQYGVLREQPLNTVFAQALTGFAAASRSNSIVGVNLLQPEDGPISLKDYRAQMHIFEFLHHLYPNVSISLHAGELIPNLKGVTKNDLTFHIREAIFRGNALRIGHGTDINTEKNAAALLQFMAQKPIPVEISLTSNHSILNLQGQKHPLHTYLAHQVPILLSTDDEGILRTDLTQQYVDAVQKHHLDYATLKAINRNALTYSFLPGKSLWTPGSQFVRVSECTDLLSMRCLKYTQHNEKARLQWQLERQLTTFERGFHEQRTIKTDHQTHCTLSSNKTNRHAT